MAVRLLLTKEQIRDREPEWPVVAILERYVVADANDVIDLVATLHALEADHEYYREKVEGAVAFKRKWNVDYDDFTDTFEDDARTKHELSRALAHVREVFDAFNVTPPPREERVPHVPTEASEPPPPPPSPVPAPPAWSLPTARSASELSGKPSGWKYVHLEETWFALAFSDDGSELIDASPRGYFHIRDGSSLALRSTYRLVDSCSSVAGPFARSRDGKRLAVGAYGEVWFVDEAGELERVGRGIRGTVHDIAWSPDGAWFAAACAGAIEIRDGETGALLRELEIERGRSYDLFDVRCVAVSKDGRWLVSADSGGRDEGTWGMSDDDRRGPPRVIVWDVRDWTARELLDFEPRSASLAWTANGSQLAFGDSDGVRILDVGSFEAVTKITVDVHDLAFVDGHLVTVGSTIMDDPKGVSVFDPESGQLLERFALDMGLFPEITARGSRFVVAGAKGVTIFTRSGAHFE